MKRTVTPKQYMILCNLIETLWWQRKDKKFYEVDFDALIPLTSPQARKVATFICETLGMI
jgi:hypothetical protein